MAAHKVVCWDCGAEVDDPFVNTCPRCGGLLTVKMDLEQVKEMKPEDLHKEPIGVWRYAPFMPVDPAHKVSIQEGGTPLYPTRALGAEIGVENTFVKFEGLPRSSAPRWSDARPPATRPPPSPPTRPRPA